MKKQILALLMDVRNRLIITGQSVKNTSIPPGR